MKGGGEMFSILGGTIASLVGSSLLSRMSALKINVIHAMPGRVRLQCNTWKNDQVAAVLMKTMKNHPLISQVNCSPITGSLVICFENQYLTNQQFQEVMDLAVKATGKGIGAKKSAATLKMLKAVQELNRGIKVSTKGILDIPAIIILALIIQAVNSFATNRSTAMKQLLWAYRLLREEERTDLD
jgi:hypothetical protein